MKPVERFINACKGEPVDSVPVWFMRQAGRYMPEYRKMRDKYTLLELMKIPELAIQVTLLPVKLGVDCLIIFSDILLPLTYMDCDLEFTGQGPRITVKNELSKEWIDNISVKQVLDGLSFQFNMIKEIRKEADKRGLAVIGFAGAPFTLASYLLEGGTSKKFIKTKLLMYTNPQLWHYLMDRLSSIISAYLLEQIKAGVHAVQLFDSWVGTLSPSDYQQYVLSYNEKIIQNIKDTGAISIYFSTGTSAMLDIIKKTKADVYSIDWRISISSARKIIGGDSTIQGNLDPAILLADWEVIKTTTVNLLNNAQPWRRYIFNLGHGILPQTPVQNVLKLVDFVHEQTKSPS